VYVCVCFVVFFFLVSFIIKLENDDRRQRSFVIYNRFKFRLDFFFFSVRLLDILLLLTFATDPPFLLSMFRSDELDCFKIVLFEEDVVVVVLLPEVDLEFRTFNPNSISFSLELLPPPPFMGLVDDALDGLVGESLFTTEDVGLP